MSKLQAAIVSLALALSATAGVASAEMYKDYTPGPGVWTSTAIEVDPNHVDDYLTGLKASDIPGLEILKKHGLIDNYTLMVSDTYVAGTPNVIISVHYVNAAALEPDQARDQMIEKEIYAAVPKAQGDTAIAGYEKYRKFLQITTWRSVEFTK
jgi:hypothetical protein